MFPVFFTGCLIKCGMWEVGGWRWVGERRREKKCFSWVCVCVCVRALIGRRGVQQCCHFEVHPILLHLAPSFSSSVIFRLLERSVAGGNARE